MLATTTDTVSDRGLWFMNGRIRFLVSKHDNADGVSVVEHVLPEGFGPPLHVHHDEDEIFHILDGEIRIQCGDRLSAGLPGEMVCLPRGVPHGFKVVSPEGARMVTITRGGFEDMLRTACRPADNDGLPENLPATPAMQAALTTICAANGIDLIGPPIA